MYERFTDRARKVMQLANQEAQRLNHDYIGTEHILLGLVKEGAGVAANVLKNLDVDLRKVRMEVEKIVQAGPDTATGGKLPPTPRAKKVVEFAVEEANTLGHNYVGTEHLLLGLLREQEGVASQVLVNLGVRLDVVREEVLNLLGHNPDPSLSSLSLGLSTPPRKPKGSDPEAGNYPAHIAAALQQLDARLAELARAKDEAVAAENFEKAAQLRDEVDRLTRERKATAQAWSGKPGELVWEYRVFLPLVRNDIPPTMKQVHDLVRQRLSDQFGGYAESNERLQGTLRIKEHSFQGEMVTLSVLTCDAVQAMLFFTQLKEALAAEPFKTNLLVLSRKHEVL
jgi:ATP-dependent Clp protease ATP-binding subunit ClpA